MCGYFGSSVSSITCMGSEVFHKKTGKITKGRGGGFDERQ